MVGKTHLHPFFQQKKMTSYKENSLFPYLLKSTVATGLKLSSNVYQMIIYNFSMDTMLGKSQFLDLTAVNMQKNEFLAIFWIYSLTNSVPLQLSNLLTLQLTSSPTHLLTYSPTLSTIGGSTASSLFGPTLWSFKFASVSPSVSQSVSHKSYHTSCH